jgi:hypothetical protein
MSIFGTELIPMGKYVAHHPDAERISTDCGDDIEQALQIAYDEDEEGEFQNGDRIAISMMHEWMPTIDGDSLIEDLRQEAYEGYGEVADSFLDGISPGDISILALRVQSTIREWLREVYPLPEGMPFWMCGKTVYQTVALPSDVAERRAAELR